MHLVVSSSLSPGTYKITIAAQSNQVAQSKQFDLSVTAFQLAKYTLTTISPSGSGTMTPTPSTYTHSANDLVTMSAAPDSGWYLDLMKEGRNIQSFRDELLFGAPQSG